MTKNRDKIIKLPLTTSKTWTRKEPKASIDLPDWSWIFLVPGGFDNQVENFEKCFATSWTIAGSLVKAALESGFGNLAVFGVSSSSSSSCSGSLIQFVNIKRSLNKS